MLGVKKGLLLCEVLDWHLEENWVCRNDTFGKDVIQSC